MRVCVLAFDGLEYELVVRWKLKHLMQKYYGKHESVVNPEKGKPYTPTCWATFITGRPYEEHHVNTWTRWGNRIIDRVRYYSPFIWIKNKRKILMKLGIKPKTRSIPDNITTIFDVIKPSIALFIPSYNEPLGLRQRALNKINKGINEYIKAIWELHNYRKREFFKHLTNNEWKLIMCWFDLADLISHAYTPNTKLQLLKTYYELNGLAKRVSEQVGSESALLIVSDHGFDLSRGDHSFHGFWSLNVKPPFEPRKITNFYKLIIKLVEG